MKTTKIKNLKTFGCSLTEGWEIDDKKKIWPYILSEKLNLKLKNYGYGTASNQGIINQVVKNCDKNSLHIIQFTSPFRIHVVDKFQDHWDLILTRPKKIFGGNRLTAKNCVQEYQGRKENKLIDAFRSFLDADHFYEAFLQNVIFLQSFLQQNKLKYYFVYGNSMGVKFNWKVGSQLIGEPFHPKNFSQLSACINEKNFIDFKKPENGFWERTMLKELPIGPKRHPLEQASLDWATHLSKHIKERI